MSDSAAFHEVDEAVRKDELRAWWGRYGTWVVAGAVIVVVGVAGLVGWRQYDTSQRAQASVAYSAALARIGQDPAAARADLEKQATSAPEPYRSLAAVVAAQLREPASAQVEALLAVAPTLASPELADLATVIAGYRSVDLPSAAEVAAKLGPLAGPDRPFRLSARDVEALVAARKGDLKRARELLTEITKDPAALPGATQRATALLKLYGAEAK